MYRQRTPCRLDSVSFASSTLETSCHSPMIMKPKRTDPGPPVSKAPALLTKRPAPMAPPLGLCQSVLLLVCLDRCSHGNHLHVTTLEVTVQLGLIGFDHANVGLVDAELTTAQMVSQRRRLAVVALLLHVRHISSLQARASTVHCDEIATRIEVGMLEGRKVCIEGRRAHEEEECMNATRVTCKLARDAGEP